MDRSSPEKGQLVIFSQEKHYNVEKYLIPVTGLLRGHDTIKASLFFPRIQTFFFGSLQLEY